MRHVRKLKHDKIAAPMGTAERVRMAAALTAQDAARLLRFYAPTSAEACRVVTALHNVRDLLWPQGK